MSDCQIFKDSVIRAVSCLVRQSVSQAVFEDINTGKKTSLIKSHFITLHVTGKIISLACLQLHYALLTVE
jgi:hypothetical protein